MKALVTGAGGFVGRALVDRLLAEGHQVVAIRRESAAADGALLEMTARLGEPLPEGHLAGLDLVVHLAHDMAPGSLDRNVDGTKRWFDQAARAGAPRQVYVTSYSAHPSAPSEYGQAKYALETYAAAAGGVVVRPAMVLGRGGVFGALAEMVQTHAILPVPGGELRVFVTTRDDVVTVLADGTRGRAGETLNVFAPEPVKLLELLEKTRAVVAGRTRLVSIPSGVALALLAVPALAHPGLRRHRQSLAALAASQRYGYPSDYARLGLSVRSLEEMLRTALAGSD
jgi:NADH dehydrogenase